jgi:hypothetical protein
MFIIQFAIYRFFIYSRSWSKSFDKELFVKQFSKSEIKKDRKRIPSVSQTKRKYFQKIVRTKTSCQTKTTIL